MKSIQYLFLAAALLFTGVLLAQKKDFSLLFKNGPLQYTANIRQSALDSFNSNAIRFNKKTFSVIQFESLPSEATRKQLSLKGIELLEYIPNNSYTAVISGDLKLEILQNAKARVVVQLSPQQKMQAGFAEGRIPSWAVKIPGTVDVWISFPKTFSAFEVVNNLKQLNFDHLSSDFQAYRILSFRIASNRLTELASLPFIEYVQPAPQGDRLLNYNSRYGSRANLLNASVANGGKGLNGEGVVVGVGDNADVQTHIDFAGRLINRSPNLLTSGHGHHTTGIVGGAGNGNELYRGYAPKATIISQAYNGIILNAPTYVNDYGMVITNNSYGDNLECNYYGTYDLYSRLLDQMAFDFPNLQNVFSAGNSGSSSCTPFLPNYHTVLGGYQSAKNVITVGATNDSGAVAFFSSRGPVRDGRTKPDIVAMGQFVASTWSGNIYGYNNGTSMSGPAVSGGLALLYQRYRQLNGGVNPKNGLMKAILCNGSSDRGNNGPDYQNGYGWMNLLRSIDMLENNHYFSATVTNGTTNTHTITIPANTTQLKVMLYWNDPASSVLSSHNLVNDLDLELVTNTLASVFPKTLDTANLNLGNVSVEGSDHINNMEQSIVNNPAAGNYSVKVKGTAITQNPNQEYFIVYDIIPVQLKITAPAGGESLTPSANALTMTKINWEAYGFSSGSGILEFSTDNGANWSTLENNVDINRAIYTWWVPNVATNEALVRITKNGTGESSTSNPFTIIAQPVISFAPIQCEGYINLNWTSIPGATDYEVMMLQGDEMKSIAISTGNSYSFSGLTKDNTYWVTVRARINGKPGRRAQAISRQPNTGTCAGNISDNDLKLDAILSPMSGRKFTSTQLSAVSAITIRIKNLDNAPAGNFDLKYSINDGAFISENVIIPVAAGSTYTHTFITTTDLSAIGNYNLMVVVKNNAIDAVTANDTAVVLIKHLDNQPLNLTSTFVDNIETAISASYEKDTIGLTGLDRYDLSRTTAYGRLRTFINSGIAYSGTKAISLDADRYNSGGNTNYFTGTFNLTNYDIATNELRLDFQFNNHGQQVNPNNKVWIRGNDSQSWIEVYDLDDNQNDPGIYKKTVSIEISDSLTAHGQSFGTSFQVRWGQFGRIAATDKENASGYSFDDIRIYEVSNDLQMINLEAPTEASCGLSGATIIKISVKNSASTTISNIPVKYSINNGNWITETIPSIAGNSTVQYSFNTTADLSALGTYAIRTLVDFNSDNFRENDTTITNVINTPVINSFPYLQNFETSNGYWYSDGKHNSWEYGTPASIKINRAASGAKAWKTRLKGNYNDNGFSYMYSPCFDLTGMTDPTLSFSVALDIENCGAQLCDAAWVEYSVDGISWTKLGTSGNGTNWYNKPIEQLWSIQDYTRWHVATFSLPTGFDRLRLRFVLLADPAVNREGVAIDDIHVYNNPMGIYDSLTMSSPVSQIVSGNNWINFTSAGKLVASVQPNNQTMGATDVQAFINSGAVRFTNSQYYHDRNITVKPVNSLLTDSVIVRFYFLEREIDSLLKATGCNTCIKPLSAYELGVSKYSDPDNNFENSSISDNNQGIWTFITPDNLAIVPFDKGYYAEFKVKDFSEFWLNNGGFDKSSALPIKLLDLTAQKSNNDVLLKWKVGSETNVARYEIELAKGNAELQANNFIKIGELISLGNSTSTRNYMFTDNEADKFGPRYYRLKIVNVDGSFSYSPLRSVVFDEPIPWHIYPNPSNGIFNLVYQMNINDELFARILDTKGSLLKEYHKTANGYLQKFTIDLSTSPGGVYLLELNSEGKKFLFKLYKQ